MSMTETIGGVKRVFDPRKTWGDVAKSSRVQATKHFANALIADHPAEQRLLLGLALTNEAYADELELRIAQWGAK